MLYHKVLTGVFVGAIFRRQTCRVVSLATACKRGQLGLYYTQFNLPRVSGGTRIFVWGGWASKAGAKCDSEGAKIQKFAENGWFWPFFLLTGEGKGGAEPPTGGNLPSMPPPRCRHCQEYRNSPNWCFGLNRGSASNYWFDDNKRFEPVTNTVTKSIQTTVVREPYL